MADSVLLHDILAMFDSELPIDDLNIMVRYQAYYRIKSVLTPKNIYNISPSISAILLKLKRVLFSTNHTDIGTLHFIFDARNVIGGLIRK